jgi:hypothetical protein
MDSYSWGQTRTVEGEGKNKKMLVEADDYFEESMIPLKRFQGRSAAQIFDPDWRADHLHDTQNMKGRLGKLDRLSGNQRMIKPTMAASREARLLMAVAVVSVVVLLRAGSIRTTTNTGKTPILYAPTR